MRDNTDICWNEYWFIFNKNCGKGTLHKFQMNRALLTGAPVDSQMWYHIQKMFKHHFMHLTYATSKITWTKADKIMLLCNEQLFKEFFSPSISGIGFELQTKLYYLQV